MSIKIWFFGLLLLSIFIFKSVSFAIQDTTPFTWDAAMHVVIANQYRNELINHDFSYLATVYRFYPPLTYLLFAPFLQLYGPTKLANFVFNLTYILSTLFILYFLTKEKLNVKPGILSAVCLLILFLGFAPVNLWELMIEIPLACSLLIFFAYFRSSSVSTNPTIKNAITMSLLAGLVGLTKGTGFVYLVIPLGYAAIKFTRRWFIFITFIIMLIISSYWYLYNYQKLFDEAYFRNVYTGFYIKKDVQGIAGLLFYSKSTFKILGPLAIIVFIATFLLLRSKKDKSLNEKDKIIAISLVISFVSISFSPNKDSRYLHAFAVLLILFSAWYIGKKITQKLFNILVLILIALLSYRILFNLPKVTKENFALNNLPSIVSSLEGRKIYYFFEDDSPYYNYANINIFPQFGIFSELNLINRNSLDMFPSLSGTCLLEKNSVIISYSYLPVSRSNKDHHVRVEEYCNNVDIANACQLAFTNTYYNSNEILKFYSCTFP